MIERDFPGPGHSRTGSLNSINLWNINADITVVDNIVDILQHCRHLSVGDNSTNLKVFKPIFLDFLLDFYDPIELNVSS